MVRGHNNKRPPTSAVKAEARRNPAPSMRLKAKPDHIVDTRPSQFRKGKQKAPEWASLKKSQHEKIPGTRIQSSKGGWPVRVVIADGKEFSVDRVAAVKKHIKKLAQQEQEKREVDRIIDGGESTAATTGKDCGGATAALAAISERRSKRKAAAVAAPAVEVKGGKKAKKEEAWRQRQQKLAELHAASVERDGRQLLSDQWSIGEVAQRTSGRAWLRLRSPESLPSDLMAKIRTGNEAVRSEFSLADDLLPVLFGDVAEAGLSLQPGLVVRCKLYTDRNGVGGCEVRSAEAGSEGAAGGQPSGSKTSKRRRKASVERGPGPAA